MREKEGQDRIPSGVSETILRGRGSSRLEAQKRKNLHGFHGSTLWGLKYPLTMDQMVDIYRRYCRGILPDDQIEHTKDIILNMENEPDLQELFDICTFRHLVK
jgi:hypothetical protein